MALITCVECGNKVSDKAECCPECGCPVELKITCVECGASISDKNEICPKCGVPLKQISNKKVNSQRNINLSELASFFDTLKLPKVDWNNKKVKFLSWFFGGIVLLSFLNSIFAPSPPSPSIIVPNRSVPFSQPAPVDRCRACKLLGDCSLFPQCITGQSNCQLRFNDITGNWERNCTSF